MNNAHDEYISFWPASGSTLSSCQLKDSLLISLESTYQPQGPHPRHHALEANKSQSRSSKAIGSDTHARARKQRFPRQKPYSGQ